MKPRKENSVLIVFPELKADINSSTGRNGLIWKRVDRRARILEISKIVLCNLFRITYVCIRKMKFSFTFLYALHSTNISKGLTRVWANPIVGKCEYCKCRLSRRARSANEFSMHFMRDRAILIEYFPILNLLNSISTWRRWIPWQLHNLDLNVMEQNATLLIHRSAWLWMVNQIAAHLTLTRMYRKQRFRVLCVRIWVSVLHPKSNLFAQNSLSVRLFTLVIAT